MEWQSIATALTKQIIEIIEALPQDYTSSWQERAAPLITDVIRQRAVSVWQPIATAPKDGTEILAWRNDGVELMHWNDDHFSRRPSPFWDTYSGIRYKSELRRLAPTHWMPLPAPPSVLEDGGEVGIVAARSQP